MAKKEIKNDNIRNFINSIATAKMVNDMDEIVECFSNGYSANIIEKEDGTFSIACFDINGYLSDILPDKIDVYDCATELQAMAVIERISMLPEWLGYCSRYSEMDD